MSDRARLTPTKNFLTNMRACAAAGAEPLVLIACGSYNPVHRMHVEIHTLAKRRLESTGQKWVVASFISPGLDVYVRGKCSSSHRDALFLDLQTRAQLIDLAIRDAGAQDWLACDLWEGSQGRFNDFDTVMGTLETHLDTLCAAHYLPRASKLLLMGSDVMQYGVHLGPYGEKELSVVGVRRPSEPWARVGVTMRPLEEQLLQAGPLQRYFLDPDETAGDSDVSSTQLARLVAAGQSYAHLVPPSVHAALQAIPAYSTPSSVAPPRPPPRLS